MTSLPGQLQTLMDEIMELYVSPYPQPADATAADAVLRPVSELRSEAERTPLAPMEN